MRSCTNISFNRFSKLKNQYDVAVIGGGIYGAATAWEAVSRGLNVVLIESEDFCSGTSANSLKTIHGGLRSLQRFDFPEIREYIRERRALLRIAPHLVTPMQCVIPTYSRFSKSRFFLGMGMKFYDLIAFDRNKGLDEEQYLKHTRIISSKKVREFAPDLDISNITGGASWFDAQVFNSERLVLAFIMSAKNAGADVFNYVRKKDYIAKDHKVTGLIATDRLTGNDVYVNAKAVIDCCGPWAARDDVFISTTSEKRHPRLMARAVNLVINRKLSSCALGVNTSVTPDSDSRLMFVAPWRRGSIVGTWYYPQKSDGDNLALSDAEMTQCLQQINSVFPALSLKSENISLVHHGLQPAGFSKKVGQEPQVWRHTRIVNSNAGAFSEGLFWVLGVKFTTARATAENVINKVADYLRTDIKPSSTSITALYGAGNTGCQAEKERLKSLSDSFSEEVISRLYKNYGSNIRLIADLCEHDFSLSQLVPGLVDTIKAELKFILENEMVYTLSDLVLRRTDIGSFECPKAETIEYCIKLMAEHFQWQNQQCIENTHQLLQQYPAWSHS